MVLKDCPSTLEQAVGGGDGSAEALADLFAGHAERIFHDKGDGLVGGHFGEDRPDRGTGGEGVPLVLLRLVEAGCVRSAFALTDVVGDASAGNF